MNQFSLQPNSGTSSAPKLSTFFKSRRTETAPFFQAKLTVGPTDDLYEKEADAVAEKVMRKEESNVVQSKPEISSIQRACAGCQQREQEEVQRRPSASTHGDAPALVSNVVGSGNGSKMSDTTRAYMENKFGYDFGSVRIHDNMVAAKSAQSVNALAYTSGNNIVFNNGQYAPETNAGKKLLAHELTHVVQQKKTTDSVQRMVQVNPGVELDTMGYSVIKSGDFYTNRGVSKTSVWNEIVTSLFFSPRVFKVAGTTNAEASSNFKKHIAARWGILEFASKKKYDFAAGAGFTMNPAYWNVDHAGGTFDVKPGVDQQKAVDDLNVNPDKYAIACEAATSLTMKGGSKSALRDEFGNASDDWVPGDWGYVKNDAFPSGGTPGLEGENIIYAGLDKFWGHFGKANEYKTLKEWFDQVKGWHGAASISGIRSYPIKGLE
jgi:hypothetical protein